MKRTITITIIALAVVAFFWASASAGYIDNLTIDEINGPKISKVFRDGVFTGLFLGISASKAVSCPMMSANMMIAGLEAAIANKEITGVWTVYHASLYVLVRAGCTVTETPTEKPNA